MLPATIRSRRGTSLVEVLVVIAILGVLLRIALPHVDYPHFRVDAAIQSVGTTLLAAQREAVSTQHDVIVQFDATNRRLRLIWDHDNDGQIDPAERTRVLPLDDQVVFGRATAPARAFGGSAIGFTRVIGGLPAVVLHRNGSASEAGGLYLTSTRALADPSHARDTRALEIVRAAGRPEWFRWNGSAWQRGF
ncbi:MAG: pilus assembly FimT family protein [Gemmatimonadales bacterium]